MNLGTYGDEVRRLRKSLKLSQVELAERVGLTQGSITNIEAGGGTSAELHHRLCGALGVPLDHFAKILSPKVSVPPPPSVDADGRYPVDVIGYVGAGPGIDEPIADERIFVEAKYRDCVAYRVRGDSMESVESDGLYDGMTIIVRAEPAPEVGETVVVWLESTQGVVVKSLSKNNTLRCGSPVIVYAMVPGDRMLGTLVKSERLYGTAKKKKGKR